MIDFITLMIRNTFLLGVVVCCFIMAGVFFQEVRGMIKEKMRDRERMKGQIKML